MGTISESVNHFIADPVRNNPLAAVGQYYKDIAKASYAGDWDTVANKLGSGTATVAVIGITGILVEGGAGKIFPKGINIDKTINLPVLEKYKYAGTGGYEIGLSTVTVPIKASISASAVPTASGVCAAAIAGQGIYYSTNDTGKTCGGGSSSQGSLSNGKQQNSTSQVSRKEAFRQAKQNAEIPKSAQYNTHKFVYDGTSENRTVYEFVVGDKKKYVIEHSEDKMGRGPHFHGADDAKGSPFKKGRYNQYDGHYPESFNGYKK